MAAPLTGFAFSAGISPNATQPFNAFTPSTFTASTFTPPTDYTPPAFTTSTDAFIASKKAFIASNEAFIASNEAFIASNEAFIASNDAFIAANDAFITANKASTTANEASTTANEASTASAFTASAFTAPNEAFIAPAFTASAFPIIDFQPPTLKLTRSLSHQMAANINAKQYMPLCKEGDTILTNYFISYGSVTFTFLTRIGDEFHETVIDEESVHDSMKRTFTFSTCKDFRDDLIDEIKQNRIYIAYLKAKEASTEPPCNKCKWNTFDGYLAGKTKCCCPIKYKEE